MDSFNDAWELICSYCRNKITEVAYNTWISRIKPLRLDFDNNTAYLLVPNDFHRQTIKRCYIPLLNEAFEAIFDNKFNIDLQTPAEAHITPPAQKIIEETTDTNYEYTFDTFIVGPSNKFAHAACLAVATNPSKAYNPLFLHGNSGLGKTHLLYAIGNEIKKNDPSKVICYIKGDDFTNELIESLRLAKMAEFRHKYRNADVLLVDDIQFIGGKESTQEEFFHTFNALHSSGKQIVISSDRPPKEIPTLEERLKSRFEWGLIADIQKPDYETRIAILRKKAELEHIAVSDSVLHYIAEKIESNIRELEGSLTRINAMAQLSGGSITLDVAREALDRIMPAGESHPATPEGIMAAVAEYFGVSEADIVSSRRTREIAQARQVAMYLTREQTQLSTTRIGDLFGGRDHTTVMHACKIIAELVEKDDEIRRAVQQLKK